MKTIILIGRDGNGMSLTAEKRSQILADIVCCVTFWALDEWRDQYFHFLQYTIEPSCD